MTFPDHGTHDKNLIVLHQTISSDVLGLSDISGVYLYLKSKGYAIHMIVDAEANSGAVTPSNEADIYYHAQSSTAGAVNTRSIGIEIISKVPLATQYWWQRWNQMRKTARWCAYLCKKHGIRPVYDPTCKSGITTHYDVTKTYHVAGGHTDVRPVEEGGAFPMKGFMRYVSVAYRLGWV
jgi:hypothetical protein